MLLPPPLLSSVSTRLRPSWPGWWGDDGGFSWESISHQPNETLAPSPTYHYLIVCKQQESPRDGEANGKVPFLLGLQASEQSSSAVVTHDKKPTRKGCPCPHDFPSPRNAELPNLFATWGAESGNTLQKACANLGRNTLIAPAGSHCPVAAVMQIQFL